MAKEKGCGYVGRVSNTGTQDIKAPCQTTGKGKRTTSSGSDMRNGKKK